MSQKGSSIGSDNPEFKYKKALLEIQKIHNANKVLKSQSEEMKAQYERQIGELTHSLNKFEEDYETIKHEKADLQKYYDQLQLSQNELRKEYNNLEREVSYLNEVLTEQNTELKKVSAFKDQKGLSSLINSYQDKEMNYRKDISRIQEINKNLKTSCESLENDLNEQRRQRFKLEDLNNSLRMEITKYRELNNILLSKNQSIVATLLSRTSEGKEKYRQAETMLSELSRQLDLFKATRIEQQSTNKNMIAIQNFEAVLHEKGKLQTEMIRLREKIDQYEKKQREGFQVEEKMKRAVLKAEQLQQESNMLKGKLIVLETKDVMESDAQLNDLKQLQERILSNGPNDPLIAIKNGSDSSHFQLMKSYILDLKEKLSKALIGKKEVDKKYRSLKEKLTEKAEKSIMFEEQNKLLKGKLEGFERLTDRLQFELQKSIEDHDDEVNKMKNMTSNIIAKKTEEVKVANAYVRAQLDHELDKFQRTEKGLRQELETLKLELSTEKIKNADLQQKYSQSNEFLAIYQKKFNEITVSHEEAEESNQLLEENSMRFEQLYREQKSKNESLLAQKHSLTNRLAEISDELDKKNLSEEDLKNKAENFEGEAKKAKAELFQAKSDIEGLQNIMKVSKKEMDSKSRVAMIDISRTDTSYYTTLENNFNQERDKNRQLEAEIQTLKVRLDRTGNTSQKVSYLENELNSKTNELNDVKRKGIETEKQINIYLTEIKGIQSEFETLRRENMALKARNMQNGQEMRRSIETKDLQSKKQIQRLNEELSSATSELRENKKTNNRLLIDNQSFREEINRLVNIIEEKKNNERNQYEELNQLRSNSELLADENDRIKSEIKYKNSMIQGFNNDINNAQERGLKLSQENSEIKIQKEQLQSSLSDLRRQITGLKFYLTEIEEYSNAKVASGNWQEQRDRENVSKFVQRVKTLLKKTQLSNQQNNEARPTYYTATSSPVPDYMKSYNDPLYYNYEPSKGEVSYQDSPTNLNSGNNNTFGALGGIGAYGAETSFKYGDYS